MPANESNSAPESHGSTIAKAAPPLETTSVETIPAVNPVTPPTPAAPRGGLSVLKWLLISGAGLLVLAAVLAFGIPWIIETWATESTDDAYVNGHVTFVAPRVQGQVLKVLVDDNNRVRKGDLLVLLDKEPYEVQVKLKQAYVTQAKADLHYAEDQVRAQVALTRSFRFKLQHAIESVNNEIALLAANVAALETAKARLAKAQSDSDRARELSRTPGAISSQELDLVLQNVRVADSQVKQALETVHQSRVSLGLSAQPEMGADLKQVPPNLDQTFSTVRQALAELLQSAATLGIFPSSYDLTPKQIVEEFYKRDPQGNIDRIYEKILKEAPAVKQAEAKQLEADRELEQAQLNLRYCDVRAEIDGVVTRRNVNPGNNVQAGQSLMAVRSVTEIWIDANFKETQLRDLRIGQRVRVEADMYGSHRTFTGRISGFTMGTGQTLALLPPQNATGNFVKIVQRLPVRIELTDYDPEKDLLFNGLSVTPYVYFKEQPQGESAGARLQPYTPSTPAGKESQP